MFTILDSNHVYTSSSVNSLLNSHAIPIQTPKVASKYDEIHIIIVGVGNCINCTYQLICSLCTVETCNIAVIGLSAAISTSVTVMCVICLVLKVHRRKRGQVIFCI